MQILIKTIFCVLITFSSLSAIKITDFSNVNSFEVHSYYCPKNTKSLCALVKKAKKPIAIAGGRYSQGGQIAYPNGTTVDMKLLNNIVAFNPKQKTITVQAGITWRKIQQYIDRYNLSVAVMQSYNDFSVGGSLSVNVHGRDINYGPLSETIESIKIVTADGDIVIATKNENADLFHGVIGGYGLCGIIVEATIRLTDNIKLERRIKQISIKQYKDFFFNHIKNDPNAVIHNANLYPNELHELLSITWYKSDKPLTITERLQPYKQYYPVQMLEEQLLRRIKVLKKIRPKIEAKKLKKCDVVWRNYEMSYSVNQLEPFVRCPTTTILQEYFIPIEHFATFICKMRRIFYIYESNVLNVSIRYLPANNDSILPFCPVESFAFVLYINIGNNTWSKAYAKRWTQELIDAALYCGGTYYLPYHLFASSQQFRTAYPGYKKLLEIKKQYDSENVFSNMLSYKYLPI